MIPKIIHYCWFGKGNKSKLIVKCIESWKEKLPGYEIIEWNEDNFDITLCPFVMEAYKHKKWAFVSDYVRIWALYNYGGIYFDTDVQVLKNFDNLLNSTFITGFESRDFPVTAVMASEPKFEMLNELIIQYEEMTFVNLDGSLNQTPNTYILADKIASYGIKRNNRFQFENGITVYPQIYFCPNNFSMIWNKPSKKSYTIHHFDQSWRTKKREYDTYKSRIRRFILGVFLNTIGIKHVLQIRAKMQRKGL